LYSLDLNTGLATLIGPTGVSGILGSGFVAGQLFGFEEAGQIVTINTSTGQATPGATTIPNVFGAVDVNSPTAPGPTAEIPEPSTFVLLGLGAAGLAGWRWPRRK
jgi:hypothetical protein